jgi:hypothetical protein
VVGSCSSSKTCAEAVEPVPEVRYSCHPVAAQVFVVLHSCLLLALVAAMGLSTPCSSQTFDLSAVRVVFVDGVLLLLIFAAYNRNILFGCFCLCFLCLLCIYFISILHVQRQFGCLQ